MEIIGSYSQSEIESGFGEWNREARFFPKPKDILDAIAGYKARLSGEVIFRPCNEGGCIDGWIEETVPAGTKVRGMVIRYEWKRIKRCQCFRDYAKRKKAAAA